MDLQTVLCAGVFMGSLNLPVVTDRNPVDIAAVVDRIVRSAADIPGVTGTGRWLASLLFGVAPGEPTTLVVVAIVVISLAVVAAWAPTRRVAHVDPAESLRM